MTPAADTVNAIADQVQFRAVAKGFKLGKSFTNAYPVLSRLSYENLRAREPDAHPELRW